MVEPDGTFDSVAETTGDPFFFRKLFDLMPQLSWTARADGYIDWYNKGWYEYTGTTFEQMRGWGWESVQDPSFLPVVKQRWLDSISNAKPFEMRFPLRGSDGVFQWFLTRIEPIFDQADKLIRWVGICTNIQNEIDQTNALVDVKTQLETVTDNASVGLLFMDEQGNCTFANPASLKMTGYTFEELRGSALHEKIHWLYPDGRPFPKSECPIDKALPEKNQIREQRHVFLRKDGTFFNVEVSASPVDNVHGQRSGTIIEVIDVTERVGLENQVRNFTESLEATVEERTQKLLEATTLTNVTLEAISDAIIVSDESGRINYLNKAARDLHGDVKEHTSIEEIPMLFELFESDGRTHVAVEKLPLARALRGEKVDDAEMIIGVHGGTRQIFADVAARPLFIEGVSRGAVVVERDVTVRKNANDEIARARDEAVAANEAKSRFLATVSHEVRTPMAGVIGLVELIALSTSQPEVVRDLSASALDSCKRLLQILNDLLDASKLQAGGLSLERRPFALRPVIGDLMQLIKADASRKGLQVRSEIHPDVPRQVCGDELRVRQILQNLAFNAVKFTEQGTITIAVDSVPLADHTDEIGIRFSVSDTGIGITPEQMTRIFEPFAQAEVSTSRVFGGTGLGLSICKTLTELMEGNISVQSEPGEGSVFTVVLPLREISCEAE